VNELQKIIIELVVISVGATIGRPPENKQTQFAPATPELKLNIRPFAKCYS